MTQSSDRRRAELAVIEAARYIQRISPTMNSFAKTGLGISRIVETIDALDALPLEPATKARAGGPLLTSQNAAAFVDGARAASMAGRILRTIDRLYGATTEELCVALNGKHQTVSARIHELWRNGWLKCNEERPTSSGLMASVWKISSEAREALLMGRLGGDGS